MLYIVANRVGGAGIIVTSALVCWCWWCWCNCDTALWFCTYSVACCIPYDIIVTSALVLVCWGNCDTAGCATCSLTFCLMCQPLSLLCLLQTIPLSSLPSSMSFNGNTNCHSLLPLLNICFDNINYVHNEVVTICAGYSIFYMNGKSTFKYGFCKKIINLEEKAVLEFI